MLNMARSSYYYKGTRDIEKQKEEADLRDRIEEIVVEYPRYGSRPCTSVIF